MITENDVIFIMQRGAAVAMGLEAQEKSEKHTRGQLEAIVARELNAAAKRYMKAWNQSIDDDCGLIPQDVCKIIKDYK